MTTIAVVKKQGQIAIAADTLTKWGYAKESAQYVVNHEKIFRVGETYIAMAGPAAMKLAVHHYFTRAKKTPKFTGVEEIFDVWLTLHDALKNKYYINPKEDDEDSFESSQMSAVLANTFGIFGVSRDRMVQEFSRFYAYGSGGDYGNGAMCAVYDDPARSAIDIAELGVRVAAEFDDATGLPLTSFTFPIDAPPPASS